ncbi:MAG: sugar phosphate nucleotidyltransferase [Candidatus Bathyarchaeota archaeon]|jgi:glucose-1-phosphate thymidylyltransferase
MKGVIVAAGEGSRIRSVTYGAFPKELLPIGNVPTIRFPIEALRFAGIKDMSIVIAPNTKHGIIDGLQSGQRFGVNISYVVQERGKNGLTGLGQAILSARKWVNAGKDFVVACGDTILCNLSSKLPFDCLKSLVNVHLSNDALATVLLYPMNSDVSRFGVAKFKRLTCENDVWSGRLESLVEKPSLEVAKTYKTNGYNYVVAGYYAFKPKIFSYIEKTKPGVKNEVQITDSIQMALENGEKIYGVVHGKNKNGKVSPCEYWDVGIPEAYKEANKQLSDINLDQLALRCY